MELKHKSGIRDVALVAVLTALLTGAKLAFSLLPNIEPTSFLLIVYTLAFGWRRVRYILPLFVLTEGLLYGFGLWWFSYLYVWAILVGVTYLFRRERSPLVWAIISALYGLLFGLLCSLPTLCVGGFAAAFAWWIAGIPFDLLHGGGNFLFCLLLFRPVMRFLEQHSPKG